MVGEFNGLPHNGKMYGFYDPTAGSSPYPGAFNPNFLSDLRKREERAWKHSTFSQNQGPGRSLL